MRVIAYYLPQFHEIEENNKWWGKGFTEWVNVKNAKPLFSNHNQPRVPLNDNYYNLIDDQVKEWQVELARNNGIYGFCFYHYWFNGHMLLEKPVEQFLNNKDLDINFCLSWANEPWSKAWVSKKDEILINQEYGNKDHWKEHFTYLLPYFKDNRYIRNDGKPLFVIYRPEQIPCLNEMLDYWQLLARENGIEEIDFAYQHIDFDNNNNKDDSRFKYNIEYEPTYALNELNSKAKRNITILLKKIDDFTFSFFRFKLSEKYLRKVRTVNYDDVWEASLRIVPHSNNIAGAFIDWDNTPRRGTKGLVFKGATPEKFKQFFLKKVKKVKDEYDNDMIFVFAWNEWAEGGYLEPDETFGHKYLNAIKDVLLEEDELPR